MSGWNPIDNPQDFVMLGGKRTPGIATITGFRRPRRWDERASTGMAGATLVYRGQPLQSGKLIILLTSTEDFDAWASFRAVLEPLPPVPATQTDAIFIRQRGRILDISHPLLDDLNIHRVVVEEDGQPEQTDDGQWTVEIALKEHRPPVRVIQRPVASTSGTPQLSALDQQIHDLSSEDAALQQALRVRQ